MIWPKSLIIVLLFFVIKSASFQLDCEISNDLKQLFEENNLEKETKKCFLNFEDQDNSTIIDEDISNITIVLSDVTVRLLPGADKIFLQTEKLVFYNLSASNIERDWFKNLINLEELYFISNNFSKLNGELFGDLRENLQVLNLYSNQITEIDETTFAGLRKLSFLDIGDNKIEVLHPMLFKDLSSLEELFMTGNPIKTLDIQLFRSLANLEALDLVRLKLLKSIPNELFKNNKKLKELYIGGPIATMHENIFAGLTKLQYLSFNYHTLESLPLKLFKDLVSLKELELFSCKNLKYLNATLFHSLVNLENLRIIGTQIKVVPDGLFEKNTKLKEITLMGKISRMSNKIFSHLKNLDFINLNDNYCVSEQIYGFQQSIRFNEDVLIPCSCELPKKDYPALKLKKFLIYSGLMGAVILVMFIVFLNQTKKSKLQKKSAFKNVFTRVLKEYISNTSIHGLNYAIDEQSFVISRIFWVAILLISIIALTYYSLNTYIRRQERPVILGFNEQLTDIFEIPFPAITVCSNFKFNKKKTDLEKILNAYMAGQADIESIKKLEIAGMFCDEEVLKEIKHPPLNETLDIREFLTNENYQLPSFYWRKIKNNFIYPTSTLTEEGVCTTINAINANLIFRNDTVDPIFIQQYEKFSRDPVFWDFEQGYTPNRVNNYPLRVFDTGSNNGVKGNLAIQENKFQYIDTYCRDNSMNMKIALHHPAEVITTNFFLIPFDTSAKFFVKPKITKTSEGLKSHSPLVRKCYFHGERQLKFFQIYTKANCELECLANLTLRYCNCSAFFMPRSKDTQICRYNQHQKCLKYARQSLTNMNQIDLNCDPASVNTEINCRCFSPCNEITYDAEQISHTTNLDELENFKGTSRYHTIEMYVYFKEKQFTSMMRSELYGFIDFISNCGGLMGLFMGVSLLSIIEIIYYCLYLAYQLIYKIKSSSNQVYDLNLK